MHNPDVRRLVAISLLVLFAALVTTDAIACPDGCQSASCQMATDHCNGLGICVFCSGGVVPVAAELALVPVVTELPAPHVCASALPVPSTAVPDHPPRVS